MSPRYQWRFIPLLLLLLFVCPSCSRLSPSIRSLASPSTPSSAPDYELVVELAVINDYHRYSSFISAAGGDAAQAVTLCEQSTARIVQFGNAAFIQSDFHVPLRLVLVNQTTIVTEDPWEVTEVALSWAEHTPETAQVSSPGVRHSGRHPHTDSASPPVHSFHGNFHSDSRNSHGDSPVTPSNYWDAYSRIDSTLALHAFRNWNAASGPVSLGVGDVVILLTGYLLDQGKLGAAYIDQLCNYFAVGLVSSAINAERLVGLVLAHEVGHNLGFMHDADVGCADPGSVMQSSTAAGVFTKVSQLPRAFSACSVETVRSSDTTNSSAQVGTTWSVSQTGAASSNIEAAVSAEVRRALMFKTNKVRRVDAGGCDDNMRASPSQAVSTPARVLTTGQAPRPAHVLLTVVQTAPTDQILHAPEPDGVHSHSAPLPSSATGYQCLRETVVPLWRGANDTCGDGKVAGAEQCDAGAGGSACCTSSCTLRLHARCDPQDNVCCTDSCTPQTSAGVCRPAVSVCDLAEQCDGSGRCPSDRVIRAGTACRVNVQIPPSAAAVDSQFAGMVTQGSNVLVTGWCYAGRCVQEYDLCSQVGPNYLPCAGLQSGHAVCSNLYCRLAGSSECVLLSTLMPDLDIPTALTGLACTPPGSSSSTGHNCLHGTCTDAVELDLQASWVPVAGVNPDDPSDSDDGASISDLALLWILSGVAVLLLCVGYSVHIYRQTMKRERADNVEISATEQYVTQRLSGHRSPGFRRGTSNARERQRDRSGGGGDGGGDGGGGGDLEGDLGGGRVRRVRSVDGRLQVVTLHGDLTGVSGRDVRDGTGRVVGEAGLYRVRVRANHRGTSLRQMASQHTSPTVVVMDETDRRMLARQSPASPATSAVVTAAAGTGTAGGRRTTTQTVPHEDTPDTANVDQATLDAIRVHVCAGDERRFRQFMRAQRAMLAQFDSEVPVVMERVTAPPHTVVLHDRESGTSDPTPRHTTPSAQESLLSAQTAGGSVPPARLPSPLERQELAVRYADGGNTRPDGFATVDGVWIALPDGYRLGRRGRLMKRKAQEGIPAAGAGVGDTGGAHHSGGVSAASGEHAGSPRAVLSEAKQTTLSSSLPSHLPPSEVTLKRTPAVSGRGEGGGASGYGRSGGVCASHDGSVGTNDNTGATSPTGRTRDTARMPVASLRRLKADLPHITATRTHCYRAADGRWWRVPEGYRFSPRGRLMTKRVRGSEDIRSASSRPSGLGDGNGGDGGGRGKNDNGEKGETDRVGGEDAGVDGAVRGNGYGEGSGDVEGGRLEDSSVGSVDSGGSVGYTDSTLLMNAHPACLRNTSSLHGSVQTPHSNNRTQAPSGISTAQSPSVAGSHQSPPVDDGMADRHRSNYMTDDEFNQYLASMTQHTERPPSQHITHLSTGLSQERSDDVVATPGEVDLSAPVHSISAVETRPNTHAVHNNSTASLSGNGEHHTHTPSDCTESDSEPSAAHDGIPEGAGQAGLSPSVAASTGQPSLQSENDVGVSGIENTHVVSTGGAQSANAVGVGGVQSTNVVVVESGAVLLSDSDSFDSDGFYDDYQQELDGDEGGYNDRRESGDSEGGSDGNHRGSDGTHRGSQGHGGSDANGIGSDANGIRSEGHDSGSQEYDGSEGQAEGGAGDLLSQVRFHDPFSTSVTLHDALEPCNDLGESPEHSDSQHWSPARPAGDSLANHPPTEDGSEHSTHDEPDPVEHSTHDEPDPFEHSTHTIDPFDDQASVERGPDAIDPFDGDDGFPARFDDHQFNDSESSF